MIEHQCPFKPGDKVRYSPSERGYDLDAMGERLTPGQTYTVQTVQDNRYVVVDGYHHPGGGIYWTEFEAV